MARRQTQNAIKILILLRENLDHLDSKWGVYKNQGYLFKTSSFKLTIDYIDKLIEKVTEMDDCVESIFEDMNNICLMTCSGDKINPSGNFKIEPSKLRKMKEILLTDPPKHIDDPFYEKLLEIDDSILNIHKISNIKNNTYFKIENVSDLINAMDLNFSKRLIGIDTTEIGTELDTRSFGNIQLIYNVAETLMYDYMTSIENVDEYDGQVVFGFRNRAVSYPQFKVVVVPSYAEYYLDYLSVLAHEAFHVIEKSQKDDSVKEKIGQMKEVINEIVKPIAYYWNDLDIFSNIPEIIIEKLTSDILADIFAICVGGEAYYSTMERSYIPLLFDLNVREINNEISMPDYLYSSFSISSIRSRICSLAYFEIYAYKKDNCTDNIINWEILSKNINLYYIKKITDEQRQNDHFTKIHKISDEINIIEEQIKESGVIQKMSHLLKYRHTDSDKKDLINHELYDNEKGTIVNLLSGTPSINQLNKIWNENDWLKPRHILSMYTENKNMSRNTFLFTLANHKYIKRRYLVEE